MDGVFRLIEEIKLETFDEVQNPAEDKRSEFHYGRVHGILFGLGLLKQRLENMLEQQANERQRLEKEFD